MATTHEPTDKPATSPPPTPVENPGAGINYELFLDCVHCGLCTASCPTYLELGNENDSPRGRIHLMRAVTDQRLELTDSVQRHLELCLDCRACETACPSGVQYGRLIEPFRIAMAAGQAPNEQTRGWFHRWILFGMFPFPARMRRVMGPARWAQRLWLDRLFLATRLWKLLPTPLGRMMTLLPPLERDPGPLPNVLPAIGRARARVALFSGCVSDVLFRHTNWATARVLQHNGCEVVVPAGQACCGAIHFHAAASEPARELAGQNLAAFDPDDYDAIIVNVAGCGAMLKDYGHHWNDDQAGRRQRFADKVKDISEFLDDLGLVAPDHPLRMRITYHDACHLAHAQRVRAQPRHLLRQIPGLELVELEEAEVCCGAAGTYNLTEPEMADRLSQRKLANIVATGTNIVATANVGCLMQIARQARLNGHTLRVVHPVELLAQSYDGERSG